MRRKAMFRGRTGAVDPPGFSFPKSVRLRKRREFLRVQGSGRRVVARNFVVVHCPSDGAVARFGFTVSKRMGGAVQRNLLRRRLREACRLARRGFPPGDYVLIARPPAAGAAFGELLADLHVARRRVAREGSGR
jgi:ribonuclease P protein component